MAMGKRKREQQPELWISHAHLLRSQGHPFYEALNGVLGHFSFDDWVEQARQNVNAVKADPQTSDAVHDKPVEELVVDKGC